MYLHEIIMFANSIVTLKNSYDSMILLREQAWYFLV